MQVVDLQGRAKPVAGAGMTRSRFITISQWYAKLENRRWHSIKYVGVTV